MKKIILLIAVLTLTCGPAFSQIKIGENAVPRQGTVLDLNSLYKGGLLLPHVEINNMGKIPNDFSDATVAGEDEVKTLAGMVVWNTRKGWEGIYAWDGDDWKRLSVNPTVINPETLGAGTGSFAGRACFDVAQTNNSDACGVLASRQAEELTADGARADFNDPVSRNQTYTFTPSGTVSNVRFYYIEDETYKGQIVESISGGNMADDIAAETPITCNIVYKNTLNSLASGKSTAEALKVAVYAVYNNGPANKGTDVMLKLRVAIKDCNCCGAYTRSGNWLAFMCYNLGADETLVSAEQTKNADPSRTSGAYFRWGRKQAWAADSGADWTVGFNPTNRPWGEDRESKGSADPCPAGFRVPSTQQWSSILDGGGWTNRSVDLSKCPNAIWLVDNSMTKGFQIGVGLFLPLAGELSHLSQSPARVGESGYYLSNRFYGNLDAHGLYLSTGITITLAMDCLRAKSVRCVAE